MNKTRTLAILVFDDVEVLDFGGPFEVFTVANHFTEPPAFNVLTVAENAGSVVTRGGLSVNLSSARRALAHAGSPASCLPARTSSATPWRVQ